MRVGGLAVPVSTTRLLLMVAGGAGVAVGLIALRQMDDRPGVPVLRDLWRALRRVELESPPADRRTAVLAKVDS
jgi:dTMP kinase